MDSEVVDEGEVAVSVSLQLLPYRPRMASRPFRPGPHRPPALTVHFRMPFASSSIVITTKRFQIYHNSQIRETPSLRCFSLRPLREKRQTFAIPLPPAHHWLASSLIPACALVIAG